MTNRTKDPLLLAGRIIATLMQAAMALGIVALAVTTPAVIFFSGKIVEEYARQVNDPAAVFPVAAMVGILLIGIAILAAMFVFFGKLRRIIRTVGEGDPFEPENAQRLNLMAWLALGAQVLILPATPLATYIASYVNEMEDAHLSIDGGIDLSGILLVIILFILARVFRHGAAMREDLEGTV